MKITKIAGLIGSSFLVASCLGTTLIFNQKPASALEKGYFDDGGTIYYSNGASYCGFVSPKHYEFYRQVVSASDLGWQDKSGTTDTGICTVPPGYFDDGNTVYFSIGNSSFCGFPTPQALESHQSSRSSAPRFGRIDIDPNKIMTYKGVC